MIETQEKPLETGYYDLSAVLVDVTTDDIKKSYGPSPFLALHLRSNHASRTIGYQASSRQESRHPHAAERFKEVANAYRTLSDPDLRKTYDEFGPKESIPSRRLNEDIMQVKVPLPL